MRFVSFMVAICFFMPLHSGIESCYTKCKHKKGIHSVAGIDFVYVINKKGDLGKFRNLKTQFDKFNIMPYRFHAQNPKTLSFKTLCLLGVKGDSEYCESDGLYVKKDGSKRRLSFRIVHKAKLVPGMVVDYRKTYYNSSMTIDEIAKNIDYVSAIYDAYKSKYNIAWIMNDSIIIKKDPNLMQAALLDLQSNQFKWDILYTDPIEQIEPDVNNDGRNALCRPDIKLNFDDDSSEPITDNIVRSGERLSSYSFVINRNGMKKILAYYHKYHFFIPFKMEMKHIPHLKSFATKECFVTAPTFISSVPETD